MIARVVEMHLLPEKTEMYRKFANTEVLPTLQKTPGFVDCMIMMPEETPGKVLGVILFKNKHDNDKYEKDSLPTIMQKLRPMLKKEAHVEFFNVEMSTFHKIFATVAA